MQVHAEIVTVGSMQAGIDSARMNLSHYWTLYLVSRGGNAVRPEASRVDLVQGCERQVEALNAVLSALQSNDADLVKAALVGLHDAAAAEVADPEAQQALIRAHWKLQEEHAGRCAATMSDAYLQMQTSLQLSLQHSIQESEHNLRDQARQDHAELVQALAVRANTLLA